MARILAAQSPGALAEAAGLLKRGALVALPTETVYGLGADAFNPSAVARIFEAKKRPVFDPLIVHLASEAQLDLVSQGRDKRVDLLAKLFWPGPLTLVIPKRKEVPDLVTAGLSSVAV